MKPLIGAQTQSASPSTLADAARVAASVSASLGLIVLAGWWLDLDIVKTVLPGQPRMMPNTALMLTFLGGALWLVLPGRESSRGRGRYGAGQALGWGVAIVGLLTLGEHLFGWHPGIDLRLFGDPSAPGLRAIPGRPSFPTALSALALGFGVALLDVNVWGVWLSEVFALTAIQVSVLAMIGHIFGVSELYGRLSSMPGTGMAVHAALGFLMLGAGLLCGRAERGFTAVLRSQTPGGTMARRWMLMPAAVLLIMGLVYLALHRATGVDQAVSSWALFMTSITVLTAAVWATAETLHQAGVERDTAHRTLEERVRQRTAELKRANDALQTAKEELARINLGLESTVQERTKHLNETIRSLETVCYNIAHDLRAPNRAIAGFAQALLAEQGAALDETGRSCLLRIAAAAQRSDALTLDLLAYGRLGHAELPCANLRLSTHVQTVIEKLGAEIAATRASVEVAETLPQVWANPVALEQVLTNLLSNALKFVDNGIPPRVKISAEEHGEHCRVLIQDNGIGISPEHQQAIFGVFQRLHPSEKFAGSGIGLAIVQKGVERMGGRVGVSSAIGKGSCFWFELRRAYANGGADRVDR